MDTTLRDRFVELWHRYFNNADLPLTFEYTDDARDARPEPPFSRHRCVIAQLHKARNGRTLCLDAASVGCRGGSRYLGFADRMFPGFNEFISQDAEGRGERYRRTPEQVRAYIEALPPIPARGRYLIVKRWDRLDAADRPAGVLFFATPDVLSGLFTLACYDGGTDDAVIAPFGAGCTTLFYMTLREAAAGTNRAIMGMFDPSARKCMPGDRLSLAVPMQKFEEMIAAMEESFLSTHSWEIIQRRIG